MAESYTLEVDTATGAASVESGDAGPLRQIGEALVASLKSGIAGYTLHGEGAVLAHKSFADVVRGMESATPAAFAERLGQRAERVYMQGPFEAETWIHIQKPSLRAKLAGLGDGDRVYFEIGSDGVYIHRICKAV